MKHVHVHDYFVSVSNKKIRTVPIFPKKMDDDTTTLKLILN